MKKELIKLRYSFFPILTGLDLSKRRLPIMEARHVTPGPIIWLTACLHGDEVGGIVIIQELFKIIRKKLLKGCVFAFPLMNPIGIESGSHNITLSMEDLNRSFPGDKNGSFAQRIAHKIFHAIIETNPSLVLDLHNDWIKSIPYTLIDRESKNFLGGIYEKIKTYARLTGFVNILDKEEIKTSLTYNLIHRNIPALTLELGESYVVNEKNIEYGVKSILNILAYLGMIEQHDDYFIYPMPSLLKDRILMYSDNPVSSTSGIIRFLRKPGDIVKKSQKLARIYNAFGKLSETIVALDNGIILGHADYSMTFPGSPVMAFGII